MTLTTSALKVADPATTPPRAPTLSIVIPVYRSAPILPKLTATISEALGDTEYELILVNDCGPDDSWRVIRELAAKDKRVRGINLRRNVGQHNAIIAGLNFASGDIVVTMDDDLQHSPHDIPALCRSLADGYDVCYARFGQRQHARWKSFGSRFNDKLASILLGKPKDIYLSPFRAMSRPVRDEIVKYAGPTVYLDGLILSITRAVTEVRVTHNERLSGDGNYNLRRSISLFLRMFTGFSIAPLRVASLAGAALSGLGFLFAIYLILQRFMSNALPAGWASILVTSLILGGVQLLALGIIGEYVGRIYMHVSGSSQFVVAGTVNLPAAAGAVPVAPDGGGCIE
ncbi:undecaprenyl-phosphate 4-deoxy-4-formamido-L-arabinose transferase [Rhizobiales bacterium GAS188]|nr:undecaprenyl-phosphate 4-deoxy-4-formamido-L-arabinose transferase [Rhizobiales bacterium GAS188]